MKFIITVDTEADNQWKKKESISLKNISFLPRFQALCEKYNFRPTYMLSYEVVADDDSVKILKPWSDDGKAEIGAHLHPWTTPPLEKDNILNLKNHRFCHELNDNELSQKLINLTEIIKKQFNIIPRSFRAGRWGIDGRVLKFLEKNNYKVDCSVTPKIDWRFNLGDPNGRGGPDFRTAPIVPYYPSYNNIREKGDARILELPMTILFTGILNEKSIFAGFFLKLEAGLLKQIINRIVFRQKWMRIFKNSKLTDFVTIYERAVKNKVPYLEFMIHSSELMPGGSPYAASEEDINGIYEKMEEMFKFLNQKKVEGMTASEFVGYFNKRRSL